MSIATTTAMPATIYGIKPRIDALHQTPVDSAACSRDWKRRTGEYVPDARSAHGKNLARRDHNVTVKPVRIKIHVDLGIESAREIALDNHGAEPLLAPDLHLGTEPFAPIQFDRAPVRFFASTPCDGYAPGRHRQRAELGRIDRQFMQGEPQVLSGLGLQSYRRSLDRKSTRLNSSHLGI